MTIEYDKHFGPLSEDLVAKFEREHNLRFPNDYREFLKQYNGIHRPKRSHIRFRIRGKNDGAIVQGFAGIEERDPIMMIPFEDSEFPPFKVFFPIAYDQGSSSFFISLRDKDYGKIYFWDADYEFEIDDSTKTSVYFVAPSFTAFLTELQTYEEFHGKDNFKSN